MKNLEKATPYFLAALTSEIVSRASDLNQTFIDKTTSLVQLSDILPVNVPNEVLEQAFQILCAKNIITSIDDNLAGTFYKLVVSEAINLINDEQKIKDSLIYKYRAIGSQFLLAAVSALRINDAVSSERLPLEEPTGIPASDRIVTINHNQQDEISARTLELIQEIEPENSIDGEDGLRELIIGRLKAGRELILAGIFSLESLRLTLVIGLEMLVEKYKDHAIGAVAGNLLSLILRELGL